MQNIKTFKILNKIIQTYSKQALTTASLDSSITIQIIYQYTTNIDQLSQKLTKGEISYLKKITKCRNKNKNKNKQEFKINNVEEKQAILYGRQEQKDDKFGGREEKYFQLQNSNNIKSIIKNISTKQSIHTTTQSNQQQQINLQNYIKITVFILHEHSSNPHTTRTSISLLVYLMKQIDNIIIVDDGQNLHNNLIHYQSKSNNSRPIIILSVNQAEYLYGNKSKYRDKNKYTSITTVNQNISTQNIMTKQETSTSNHNKDYYYFLQQLQKYRQIWQLYMSHVGMRVCAYQQQPQFRFKTWNDKLRYLINTVNQYRQSQDDLDVLLRQQIPTQAYIKIINHCGYKLTLSHIKQYNNQYRLVNQYPQRFYTFRLVTKEQQKQQQSYNRNKNLSMMRPADELFIWVLRNGLPILELAPQYLKNNKGNKRNVKLGSCNDRFQQIRSLLGYTIFQMEEKICGDICKPEKQKIGEVEQNKQNTLVDNDDDSLSCQNSQFSSNQFSNQTIPNLPLSNKNPPKKQQCTCIINIIDPNITDIQLTSIIQQQIKNILKLFLQERKNIYQNIEINKNIVMINKIVDLLQVQERDLYHILYINKL